MKTGNDIVISLPANLNDVGNNWGFQVRAGGTVAWGFARSLLAFTESEAGKGVTQEQIGEACAKAESRATAYGRSVVCRWLKAARAHPTQPANAAEAGAFSAIFNGNTPKAAKAAKPERTEAEKLADWLAASDKLIRGGAQPNDLISALHNHWSDLVAKSGKKTA